MSQLPFQNQPGQTLIINITQVDRLMINPLGFNRHLRAIAAALQFYNSSGNYKIFFLLSELYFNKVKDNSECTLRIIIQVSVFSRVISEIFIIMKMNHSEQSYTKTGIISNISEQTPF